MSEPRTLREALLSPHSKQWEKAVESEFNQLVKAKVFDWIEHLPNDKKAIGSHIVFKEKLDGYRKHVKFKARIVAQGFLQVPGLGHQERGAVDIVGWTDSDWAGDVDLRHSVGGFVFDVAEGCISWSSKKHVSVATSSVEAGYVASANTTKEAVWLQTLLKEVGYPQSQVTIVHADNQGAIALAQNPTSHSRAKHIDIRFHFI